MGWIIGLVAAGWSFLTIGLGGGSSSASTQSISRKHGLSVLVPFTLALSGCLGAGSSDNNVTPARASTITSVSIAPAAATAARGLTTHFTAMGIHYDGTSTDITNQVIWYSSNASTATINSTTGVATGVAAASTTITAALNSITSNSATLTVTPAVLASIAITPTSPNITRTGSQQFSASGRMTDGTAATGLAFTWSSSNTAIASINSFGLATGVSLGRTNITASSSGFTSNPAALNVITLMGGAVQSIPNLTTAAVTTFAGSGGRGTTDATGVSAKFNTPYDIATDGTSLYVADTFNHTIRQIVIETGAVTTLAGSGTAGSADGTGAAAAFNTPNAITTDGTNLFVVDSGNYRIRKIVIATGVVSTLAGSSSAGSAAPVDATGTAATFVNMNGITTDGTNLYVTENGAGTGVCCYTYTSPYGSIRQIVITTGVVSHLITVAGWIPNGITTDYTNLYVANAGIHRIEQVAISTGLKTLVAGSDPWNGTVWITPAYVDGTGTAARFNAPLGITTDGTNLYVSDTSNNRIRKIVIASGVVTTLAGSGTAAAVDANGTAASFNLPHGITTDGSSLFVVDTYNYKIRKIQ